MTDKELDELLPKAMAQLDDEKANVSKPENKRILLTKLTDANTDMRFSAATYLTWVSNDPEVQKALLERCNDTKEDQHVRAKAGTILTNHLDNEPIRKAMLELLKDSDWYVSDNIAEYLEHHAENYPDVANALQAKKVADENFLQEFEKEGKNSSDEDVITPGGTGQPKRSQKFVWGVVAVAALVVLGVFSVWMLPPKTEPTPNIIVEKTTNIFVGSSDDDLKNVPVRKDVAGGKPYRLRKIDEKENVIFSAEHPEPLQKQGLLHIANSVELVAVTAKNQRFEYHLKQLKDKWEENQAERLEYLVIVTYNNIPEGWPETFVNPVKMDDVLTKDELKKLQELAFKSEAERKNESIEILNNALKRKFADKPFGIRVSFYPSENPN